MHKNVRVSLSFLSTIRYWVLIKAVTLVVPVCPALAGWIGERSGLNQALREYLEESDRREAGSEPPCALQAKS
jgi:hypothetical protein